MDKIVLVKGDCHADETDILGMCDHLRGRGVNLKDVVIFIAGDFGIPWPGYPAGNAKKLQLLNDTGATIIAVLGNHEWWSLIESMPQGFLFGSNVHQCFFMNKWYNHIHYVTDPTVMTIDKKRYLLIPGADSHDIQDGIIPVSRPVYEDEPMAHWHEECGQEVRLWVRDFEAKHHYHPTARIDGYSWWKEEAPQLDKVYDIIEKRSDFHAVISHDAPAKFAYEFQKSRSIWSRYPATENERIMEDIYNKINFKYWVHGHFHEDLTSREDSRITISYFIPKVLSDNFSLTTEDKYDMISDESFYWVR